MTRRYARPLSLFVVALTVAACGPRETPVPGTTPTKAGAGAAAPGPAGSGESSPAVPVPVVVTASVADGATVPAGRRVRLTATGGLLDTVTLRTADGTDVTTAAGVKSWTSPADLAPLTSYAVEVATVDSAGTPSTFTRTFATGAPATELRTNIAPFGDQLVGVGMPITVTINRPVTGEARKAVERSLSVTADKDFGQGSWAWLSPTELHYRPAEFWPAYTHVTVHSALAGVHAGVGIWGVKTRDVTFRTGRALVLRIDDATHKMTVSIDGKHLRDIAVSLGKPKFETRSGIKVISAKTPTYHMRSATIGVKDKKDPNYYDVTVPYAMRITNSGEFIHGAPWNKLIGKADASHGCTNVALADAIWLYNRVLPGDPVITTGTVKKMEGWNGVGAEWNYGFSFWKTLSAL